VYASELEFCASHAQPLVKVDRPPRLLRAELLRPERESCYRV
jgi:hypothetical protein